MGEDVKKFNEFRQEMNDRILASGNLEIKRFFSLDKNAYKDGALKVETKELLGLVASLGLTDEQLYEAFNVGLVVGGSIVIPHLRKAVAMLDELRAG